MTTPDCPLGQVAERFLRRADAVSTRLAYEREVNRFLRWLPPDPGLDLLLDYRDHLRERALAPATIRWRLTVARAFLVFARSTGTLDHELDLALKLPRGQSGFAPRILSKAELAALLRAPDQRSRRGKRDAFILGLLGVGGLRAGEVCRLNARDVEARPNGIVLRVNGKGRKRRLVPIPTSYGRMLHGYLVSWPESSEGEAPLFWCGPAGHENKRLTVAAVDYLLRRACERAGIRRISAHGLRHTAASHAIEAGEPLHMLRDRLGHSSVLVTSRYLHVAATVD